MEIPNPSLSEPALAVGTITGVVGAALTVAMSFGLDLTAKQTAAILAFTTIVGPFVSGWFTRNRVYSPATVAKMRDKRRQP